MSQQRKLAVSLTLAARLCTVGKVVLLPRTHCSARRGRPLSGPGETRTRNFWLTRITRTPVFCGDPVAAELLVMAQDFWSSSQWYTHTHTHARARTHTHKHTHTHMHAHTHARTHTHSVLFIQVSICVFPSLVLARLLVPSCIPALQQTMDVPGRGGAAQGPRRVQLGLQDGRPGAAPPPFH